MNAVLSVVIILIVVVLIVGAASIRIIQQYQDGVPFRLGQVVADLAKR